MSTVEFIADPRFDSIRQHASLFDTRRQAVIGTTLTGEIVYWNRTAERIFGWKAPEVEGRLVIEVTPASATRAQAEEIMARLRDGRSWSGEFRLQTREGEEFMALVRDVPVLDAAGELVGIVGITTPH